MIYCVEDDASIREIELYTLRSTGFNAEGFADSKAFFEAIDKELPKLIILDVMLPNMDGVEILTALKADPRTKEIPVIMATAKGSEYDKIQSLDLGADDYLVKPFGMMEMVSRVKAVLRRSEPKESARIISKDNLTVNLTEHTVHVDGSRVELTLKEFELLRLFLENPGRAFTRDQILSDIWGIDYDGETRTVDVHVRTLRKKLGNASKAIETVRGVGYRLEAHP
ncbi:MAG: winged helix-turn-helix domain-containing protein [Sphaerochaeta sp.]|jgi:two-component system alkaline phosphatase synthesis response regulator PhoP